MTPIVQVIAAASVAAVVGAVGGASVVTVASRMTMVCPAANFAPDPRLAAMKNGYRPPPNTGNPSY